MATTPPKTSDGRTAQQFIGDTWAKLGQGGGFGLDDFTGLAKNTAVDGAHLAGTVASNPVTQGLTMAALMATGVGAPAAAAIMAATRGGGALLKDGGNIGDGIRGGLEGAAMGYGAGKAGEALYAGVGGGAGGAASTAGTLANMGKAAVGAGSSSSSGGSTADTVKRLLGLAGTTVAGVQGYNSAKANGAGRDAALERNTGISTALEQQGRSIMAGQAPIRGQAEGALSSVLGGGPPVTPNVNALADTRNPFRARYGPAVPPPPAAGVMPAAAAAPIPGATQVSPEQLAGFLAKRRLPAGS